MTVLNAAIGMPSDEQKKQIEEWHQRLPKCGCGRVGRYETSTGLACNKYMRCDNAEFMAEQIEQLRSVLSEQEATIKALMSENVEMRTLCDQMGKALDGWINTAANCSIESGCCGCGEDMARHSSPMCCGHSPVDMADAVVNKLIGETDEALAAWRQWKEKAQ